MYRSVPPPLPFWSNLKSSEKLWMWNCPIGKNRSSFVSEIMRTSILFFITLTNESNLFFIESMFNWAHINLFTFLSLRFLRISFGLPVWTNSVDPLFGVSRLWLFLSKSRNIDVFKLVLRCWCQFSFTRNLEKLSAKILIPLLLKCSLLTFKCLLGSMLSSCEGNEIFLSLHIRTSQRFTQFALFLKSSSLGTMPNTHSFQPAHNVPRTSLYGPVLVETSWTIIGPI